MPPQVLLDVDLQVSVRVPDHRTVTGTLTSSGSGLDLWVSDHSVFAGRSDASAIRGLARGLAEWGLTIRVSTDAGPLVTLGSGQAPWWQRWLTGSRHIRIESGRALRTLARGRLRGGSGAVSMVPPATVWPIVPTLGRRRRVLRTTHDPEHGGYPSLVVAPGASPPPGHVREVLPLSREVTTIGSDADCDIVLEGVQPRLAEIRHDDQDEFVLVRLGRSGTVLVNGAPVERAVLRTASRVDLGDWTMTFTRAEYADHGRAYGGRTGGETGHNTAQPPRTPRRRGVPHHDEPTSREGRA